MAARAHADGRSSISTPADGALRQTQPRRRATLRFDAMGDGVTFLTPPLATRRRSPGPSARNFLSPPRPATPTFSGAARVLARPQGGGVPGRDRSAHADRHRAGCARRTAARQGAVDAVAALSHAHEEAAAQAGRSGRTRHRNLADLNRRAGRPPRRPDGPRQGLRLSRAERREAVELQERVDRLRPVPARRSARPAARTFSAASPACISAARHGPICCCPSFRRRKNNRISGEVKICRYSRKPQQYVIGREHT